MKIGPISMVGRETALNKQNAEIGNAQKTLEKLKEFQENKETKPVGQIHRNQQGCIDIFA